MDNEYGPRMVSIERSGFAWGDSAWRFLAWDGRFYAYAETPEMAFDKLGSAR